VANRDPVSGAETILPSILPDEFADNHTVEPEICMRWFASDAGQVAKIEAPAGFANVRAHAMMHKAYVLKQQPGAGTNKSGTTQVKCGGTGELLRERNS
jgi:hypothetical protein